MSYIDSNHSVITNLRNVSLACLLILVGCGDSRVVSPTSSGSPEQFRPQASQSSTYDVVFSDNYVTGSNQDLSNRTSTSGHTYSGADVAEFVVEASSNSTYASAPEPDGNSAWWATPDIEPKHSSYRSVMEVTLGSTQNWAHAFVGVRHDGELRGTEDAYSLNLRGGNGGLALRRHNGGTQTILDSDSDFTTNNNIVASTPVIMELQAKTDGNKVILNAWVTVDGGTRQHVYQDVEDTSGDRITDKGRPAFGQSINLARIREAEMLEEVIIPAGDYHDTFVTSSNEDLNFWVSNSGHYYSGADVAEFVVEASSNSMYASAPEPDGNSAWWATPLVAPDDADYRAAMEVTLGGTNNWIYAYVGVRHDGELRGNEDAYSLTLRGGNGGLSLRRHNNGTQIELESDAGFTNNNNIGASTPVEMEIQAETVGSSVVLNAWVTVDGGTRQHVFTHTDTSGDRITGIGTPAYGMSINYARIHEAKMLEVETISYYHDSFVTGSNQDLSNRTSDSGHTYSGADVAEYVVEASSNSMYASASEPDGNSAWWATPDFTPDDADYRAVMEVTLGGTNDWIHSFIGVRHDGELRGSETAYSVNLRGGGGGIALRRHVNGTQTVLDSDEDFTTNNNIGSSTPVLLELQAENVDNNVVLSAWATVDGGTRQHVFHYTDASGSRITSIGRPAYGMSINFARIHEAEVLDVEDAGTPPPPSGGADPVAPNPPLLSTFESYMIEKAINVGNWQATISAPSDLNNYSAQETYQDTQYYDGLWVHMQIRDYAQANLSGSQVNTYLNNVSSYISKSLTVSRDHYVLHFNGDNNVRDWRRFPKGVYHHYQETSSSDSYDATLLYRNGKIYGTGDPVSNDYGHANWVREIAYWVQANVYAEKLGQSRNVSKMQAYIANMENHMRQTKDNDYTNPTKSGDVDFMQPFWMGLAGMALIEWYEHAGNDYWPTGNWATIPDALKDYFGWLIDTGPNGAKVMYDGTSDPNTGEPMWIPDYNSSGYGLFRAFNQSSKNTNPYLDVSNLITPIYWWIGNYFDEAEFIEHGDDVFGGAVTHTNIWNNNNRGKVLGQHHVVSLTGLQWRQEYVARNN